MLISMNGNRLRAFHAVKAGFAVRMMVERQGNQIYDADRCHAIIQLSERNQNYIHQLYAIVFFHEISKKKTNLV